MRYSVNETSVGFLDEPHADAIADATREAFRQAAAGGRTVLLRGGDRPGLSALIAGAPLRGGRHVIHLIDPFAGRWPVVLDAAWAAGRPTAGQVRPALLLDSNVVSRLALWAHRHPDARPEHDDVFRALARHVAEVRCDLAAFFYAIETTENDRSGGPKSAPHVRRAAEAMLLLRTMDRERFLERGELVPDPAGLHEAQDRHGVDGFDAVVDREVALMLDGERFQLPLMALVTRAVLLQAALLKVRHGLPAVGLPAVDLPAGDAATGAAVGVAPALRAAVAELRAFQHDVLGLDTARDRVVALALFTGALGDQVEAPAAGLGADGVRERLRMIRSTAWDLGLQRLPDVLLGLGDSRRPGGHASMAAVATMDGGLADVAAAVTTRAIFCEGDPPRQTVSLLEWSGPSVAPGVSDAWWDALMDDELAALAARAPGGTPPLPFLDRAALEALVGELEAEYRAGCR